MRDIVLKNSSLFNKNRGRGFWVKRLITTIFLIYRETSIKPV